MEDKLPLLALWKLHCNQFIYRLDVWFAVHLYSFSHPRFNPTFKACELHRVNGSMLSPSCYYSIPFSESFSISSSIFVSESLSLTLVWLHALNTSIHLSISSYPNSLPISPGVKNWKPTSASFKIALNANRSYSSESSQALDCANLLWTSLIVVVLFWNIVGATLLAELLV